MNPSRTIYNSFLAHSGKFDTGKFIESILLFDKSLISSAAVLPKLIKATGAEGTLRLLRSGLLGVVGGGFTAQGTYDFKNPGFFRNRPLDRPLRYGFETIFVDHTNPSNSSPEELLERELNKTENIVSIDKKDLLKIRDAILPTMKIIDGRTLKTGDDFRADLNSKQDLIVGLVVDLLVRATKLPVDNLDWRINISEVSEDIYQIDSNLSELLRITKTELHEFLKGPFFEITGMNLTLHRMRAVNAAAGLTEAQTHIIEKRVDFLSRIHIESDTRQCFAKILEVTDIPTLASGSSFDVDTLIKLRETDVARSFRDWIQHSQTLDERDIQELIGGWRKKLGEIIKTKNVKGMRFLTSTGIGSILGPAGAVVSGLDYFLDKFLPGMGPIGFVVGDYRRYIQKQSSKYS